MKPAILLAPQIYIGIDYLVGASIEPLLCWWVLCPQITHLYQYSYCFSFHSISFYSFSFHHFESS